MVTTLLNMCLIRFIDNSLGSLERLLMHLKFTCPFLFSILDCCLLGPFFKLIIIITFSSLKDFWNWRYKFWSNSDRYMYTGHDLGFHMFPNAPVRALGNGALWNVPILPVFAVFAGWFFLWNKCCLLRSIDFIDIIWGGGYSGNTFGQQTLLQKKLALFGITPQNPPRLGSCSFWV